MFVAFASATTIRPTSIPMSSTASVEIRDTTRKGPHCSSTWLITRSETTAVTIPVKWFRRERVSLEASMSGIREARERSVRKAATLAPSTHTCDASSLREAILPSSVQRLTVSSLTPKRLATSATRYSNTSEAYRRCAQIRTNGQHIGPQDPVWSRGSCRRAPVRSVGVEAQGTLPQQPCPPSWHAGGMQPVVAVITVSDRSARGERPDTSGPTAVDLLGELGFEASLHATVPDDVLAIRTAVRRAARVADVVVTTGGTGLSPRDVTPEAMDGLLDLEIPGLADALRRSGADHGVATAVLSRGRAGVVTVDGHRSLVVNAPGSTGGVRDAVGVLAPLIGHAVEQLGGADH